MSLDIHENAAEVLADFLEDYSFGKPTRTDTIASLSAMLSAVRGVITDLLECDGNTGEANDAEALLNAKHHLDLAQDSLRTIDGVGP